MKIQEFIKENREELDQYIANALGRKTNPLPNDRERRLWIDNDEKLYNWARSYGCKI